MTKSTGARLTLPRAVKAAICMQFDDLTVKTTHEELALWAKTEFKLPRAPSRPAIHAILKQKDTWYSLSEEDLAMKKDRRQDVHDIDLMVIALLEYCELEVIPMTGTILMILAKKIAMDLHWRLMGTKVPDFTGGWLQSFMKRHKYVTVRLHGEQAATDFDGAERNMDRLQSAIRRYELRNVHNADEAAYQYRSAPKTTLTRVKRDRNGKKIPRKGGKGLKQRITLLVGSNADGSDKLPLIALDLSKTPRCIDAHSVEPFDVPLKHQWRLVDDLWVRGDGTMYHDAENAWMNGELFEDLLSRLNSRMIFERRRILVIYDGAKCHNMRKNVRFSNIELLKLPPNTTAILQPMDQGVIAALKHRISTKQVVEMLARSLARSSSSKSKCVFNSIDVWDALLWAHKSWEEISQQTLANCWKRSGLLT